MSTPLTTSSCKRLPTHRETLVSPHVNPNPPRPVPLQFPTSHPSESAAPCGHPYPRRTLKRATRHPNPPGLSPSSIVLLRPPSPRLLPRTARLARSSVRQDRPSSGCATVFSTPHRLSAQRLWPDALDRPLRRKCLRAACTRQWPSPRARGRSTQLAVRHVAPLRSSHSRLCAPPVAPRHARTASKPSQTRAAVGVVSLLLKSVGPPKRRFGAGKPRRPLG